MVSPRRAAARKGRTAGWVPTSGRRVADRWLPTWSPGGLTGWCGATFGGLHGHFGPSNIRPAAPPAGPERPWYDTTFRAVQRTGCDRTRPHPGHRAAWPRRRTPAAASAAKPLAAQDNPPAARCQPVPAQPTAPPGDRGVLLVPDRTAGHDPIPSAPIARLRVLLGRLLGDPTHHRLNGTADLVQHQNGESGRRCVTRRKPVAARPAHRQTRRGYPNRYGPGGTSGGWSHCWPSVGMMSIAGPRSRVTTAVRRIRRYVPPIPGSPRWAGGLNLVVRSWVCGVGNLLNREGHRESARYSCRRARRRHATSTKQRRLDQR